MRRSSGVAAFLLGAIVLFAPAVLTLIAPADHNLTEVSFVPLVLYWTVGSALLIAPILALTTLPGDWFERWWTAATTWSMSISNTRFAIGLVLVTTALTAGASWYCFANRPTTADEIAQLFHARILLSGHLSLPPDANPEFFAIDNVIDHPRWMSQFPIGGPAVLALGVAIGAPWVLNSVLTALTALNVYRFARVAYHETQARTAAVLYAACPMVLIMGGSQMNHTPTAFFVTLALASLANWIGATDGSRLIRHAAIVGLALGIAVTIRPLDGALATVLMGGAMLWLVAKDRTRLHSVIAAVVAGAMPVALLLAANWSMTGRPFLFGYEVLWGPNHSWGLHDDPLGHPHDAMRALLLGLKYATLLDWSLTAWPVPVLLIVAFGLTLSRQTSRWDMALTGGFFAFLVAYAMYWHDGEFIGPRFLFTAAPAVIVLTARAAFAMAAEAQGTAKRLTLALLPACVFMSWVRPMPPFGVRGITTGFRESRKSLKRETPDDRAVSGLPRSLVFVQEGASARLTRRVWGLGLSRQDAARLSTGSDACSLLDAVRREERRERDPAASLQRIEASTILLSTPDRVVVPGTDPFWRVNNGSLASSACIAEMQMDERVGNTVSYGPLLLKNRYDALGRVDGQVIYVMNLGERNELLRARFGDRQWFRYEIPVGERDSLPKFIPYETPAVPPVPPVLTAAPPAAATKKAP